MVIGTTPWYLGLAGIATLFGITEGAAGIVAGDASHVTMAILDFAAGTLCVVAGAWRRRGATAGPAIVVGAATLGLSLAVAIVFPTSPGSILLPMVAFAFVIPSLAGRALWAFGGVAVAFGGLVAFVVARDTSVTAADLGRAWSAAAGVIFEGTVIMVVLIRQRLALAGLVARLSSIVEQVPMGVFRTTPEGVLLDANQWFADMLGHPTAEALVGTRLADHVADEADARALLEPGNREGVRLDEVRLRRSDGSSLWAKFRIRAVPDESGGTRWFQGAARDNTEEHAASVRQARLAAAVEQTAETVMIADAAASIVYVNPAFERTTGYSRAEVLGQNPRILQSGHHPPEFYRSMWSDLLAGRPWRGEIVNRRKDGSLLTEETTITPVLDRDGELSTYVAVKRDVTAERDAAASRRRIEALRAERRSVADSIARLGSKETPTATAEAITTELLALDGVLGAGLITFENGRMARLMSVSGPPSLPVRTGQALPEPFAAYLRRRAAGGPWFELATAPEVDAAFNGAAAGIGVQAIAYAPIGEGGDVFGILAFATGDAEYAHDLVDHLPALNEYANAARLLLVDAWQAERRLEDGRMRISSILETAAFQPVFQPVVDLLTGDAVGFEALTRFEPGTTPPDVFGEARRVGLGLELEAATLRAALAASVDLPPHAWLSLNVSPALILARDDLQAILAARTRSIVLEVTEHDTIDDYPRLRDAFVALGADLRLAVDDAGAGVANFNHIVELRPDFVKVDIGLIRGINADLSRQAMVVGLHHFARASNRDVIAEGVETAAELTTLLALDVRFGQGYLLGKPAPAAAWRAVGELAPEVTPSGRSGRRHRPGRSTAAGGSPTPP